jgi:hypothetical protein
MVGKAFKGAGQLLDTAADHGCTTSLPAQSGHWKEQGIGTQQQKSHDVVNLIPDDTPFRRIERVQAMVVPNLRRSTSVRAPHHQS